VTEVVEVVVVARIFSSISTFFVLLAVVGQDVVVLLVVVVVLEVVGFSKTGTPVVLVAQSLTSGPCVLVGVLILSKILFKQFRR